MTKEIKILLIGLVLVFGAVFIFYYFSGKEKKSSPVDANQDAVYESQTSNDGGVGVTVTPKNLATDAPVWEFEVVLDTHSVELDYDMAKNSALVDPSGNQYLPLGWEGDPPGGHHRKGVLKFRPMAGARESIKLKIFNIGGVAERDFVWRFLQI